eukprot:9499080-Pyramimonas_sp.AAC.1
MAVGPGTSPTARPRSPGAATRKTPAEGRSPERGTALRRRAPPSLMPKRMPRPACRRTGQQ